MTAKVKPKGLYLNAIPLQRAPVSPPQTDERRRRSVVHRFEIGQVLTYSPGILEATAWQGRYRVVRLLPAESGDNQYRLKSESDGHERVVRESQLSVE